jgi:hypothetical protein
MYFSEIARAYFTFYPLDFWLQAIITFRIDGPSFSMRCEDKSTTLGAAIPRAQMH